MVSLSRMWICVVLLLEWLSRSVGLISCFLASVTALTCMARAGASEVYSESHELLEQLLCIDLSRTQVFRVTHQLGEPLELEQTAVVKPPSLAANEIRLDFSSSVRSPDPASFRLPATRACYPWSDLIRAPVLLALTPHKSDNGYACGPEEPPMPSLPDIAVCAA